MAKKKQQAPKTISNRRARHDYDLGDGLIVGLELNGRETKSLRLGHGQLRGAYVTVKDNQLWLINAAIIGTTGIPISESEQTRARRLLARRKQIDELIAEKQQGKSIIPTEILTQGRYIKLRISVGRGKKNYDKRHTLKARDDKRAAESAIKSRQRLA
jgi:SsrA-binding protein